MPKMQFKWRLGVCPLMKICKIIRDDICNKIVEKLKTVGTWNEDKEEVNAILDIIGSHFNSNIAVKTI